MYNFFEIDYEIEAVCDEYGDFPLQCATLLFDILNINCNIIIKNQYSIKEEKADVLQKYIKNEQNCYYEWSKGPEGNYCVWIKQKFLSNQELIDILKLQGTYLSYIVPKDSFNWEKFLANWQKDERYLILSDQVSFICNVIDMDRTLNINFNNADFSVERIMNFITEWERVMNHTAESVEVRKKIVQMRSKYGNKHLVRICFL